MKAALIQGNRTGFRAVAVTMPVPPGDGQAVIFIVWSRYNPVKYTDPDRKTGRAVLHKDDFQTQIDLAILQIVRPDFGKTTEGKIIVDKLLRTNEHGRIIKTDLNKGNQGDENPITAFYDHKSDFLYVDENLPYIAYAPTLAHDGTHKKEFDEGKKI
jgi:hypothetical protein